jgi:ligand-binding SRPBCC domain-containing protein
MVTYHLVREQVLAKPLPEVFAFFERPENLAVITPPWMNFLLLSSTPVPMAKGTRIDYALRILGLRIRWTSLITDYDPPRSFTDEQVKGPYALWHHRHTFTPQGDGVLARDEVSYALPFGILGQLVHAIYVRGNLKRIFDYREKMLRELVG